ncbi:hypothetical protein [Paragemmobacter aquarius]|uniref:hypothetical protein n=1 Tax=Paragemmobacter aquarius TaxID=2169400 RepID=UPI00131F2BB8|nr:hypothetical protein [Gemmobacter aquarius]
MTASTLWSDAPKNRYAAERSGLAANRAAPDAHAARRHTTALAAGIFLAVNLVVLVTLTPTLIDTLSSIVTLTDVSSPRF